MAITLEELPYGHPALDAVWRLRIEAWEPGALPGLPALDRDDHDAHAHHLVGRIAGEVVAAARLCVHAPIEELPDRACFAGVSLDVWPGPYALLGRRVVHPTARGRGLGTALITRRLEIARARGARTAFAWARDRWRPSMERLGFAVIGVAPASSIPAWKVPDEPHWLYARALEGA